MIDLITGHQGIPHISAEQISTLHRSLMGTSGDNTVIKMTGGNLAQAGLAVEISAGFWRVHGYDMEIQEGETVLFDPTESGYSRIDNVYVEVLQDISSGVQRAELVNVMGEPSTTTPTAPSAPTEPENSYDILIVAVPVLTATITEGAMTFTDLTAQYENVTHEELSAVQTIAENAQSAADSAQTTSSTANTNANHALAMIKDSDDAYSPSKPYVVGNYVIYNNTVYRCKTDCSAASWTVNQSNFEKDTLIGAVTDLSLTLNAQHRRKRGTFTPSGLRQCITSDGVDLSIMGYSIGDEYQINTNYKAVIADLDPFYGGYDSYASVSSHHVGLLIVGKAGTITCKWNNSDSTASGYNGSVLHTTLKGLISTIESALGTLLSHQKLLTTATSNWAWQANQKISALSESQIYGAPIWSLDGYQQGEACRQLEVFRKFSFNEIFGNQHVWLRSAQSASYACDATNAGGAYSYAASHAIGVVGLVLFH